MLKQTFAFCALILLFSSCGNPESETSADALGTSVNISGLWDDDQGSKRRIFQEGSLIIGLFEEIGINHEAYGFTAGDTSFVGHLEGNHFWGYIESHYQLTAKDSLGVEWSRQSDFEFLCSDAGDYIIGRWQFKRTDAVLEVDLWRLISLKRTGE